MIQKSKYFILRTAIATLFPQIFFQGEERKEEEKRGKEREEMCREEDILFVWKGYTGSVVYKLSNSYTLVSIEQLIVE